MTQTLVLVILFVVAISSLPWLVRRMQLRRGRFVPSSVAVPRVLSAVAVGPQQRVVTVEVGDEGERTTLVLGVTAQSIRCLHVLPSTSKASSAPGSFSHAMAQASVSDTAERGQSDSPMRQGLPSASQ